MTVPAFFKISMVLITIGILVILSVPGVVKSAFAISYPGECTATIFRLDGAQPTNDFGYYWSIGSTGTVIRGSSAYQPGPSYGSLKHGFYEFGMWYQTGSYLGQWHNVSDLDSTYPQGCPPLVCSDEKAVLEVECGGSDKYFIDEETCEGHCLPDDDCSDEYAGKIEECGSVQDIIKWSNETCEGLCSYIRQNVGPPDRCENQQ